MALHPYPLPAIFSGDYGLCLCAESKVLMLNNTCVRRFSVGVVNHSIALIVISIQNLGLESHATIALIGAYINHAVISVGSVFYPSCPPKKQLILYFTT